MCFSIREDQAEDEEGEQGVLQSCEREAKVQEDEKEQETADQLDDGIAWRYAFVAPAAASAEYEPAQDRNIVVCGDRCVTRGTRRTRRHYGEPARKAVYADIQKAAECQSEDKNGSGKEIVKVHCAPVPGEIVRMARL